MFVPEEEIQQVTYRYEGINGMRLGLALIISLCKWGGGGGGVEILLNERGV